jgi:hypothetical protein
MKRLRILAVVVLLAASLVGYDYYRSTQFAIEVVELTPQPAPADGQTPVRMKVRVTDGQNRPVKGHYLFAFPRNGGLFSASRTETDINGEAVYMYYPYKASALMPVKNVLVDIIDESNSIFIEINTKKRVVIELVEPETETKSKHSLDDIFGE